LEDVVATGLLAAAGACLLLLAVGVVWFAGLLLLFGGFDSVINSGSSSANANADDNGTVLMDTDEVLDKLNNVSKKIKAANDEVDHPIVHHDDVEAYIHNKLTTKKGRDAFAEDEPELITLSNPPNSNASRNNPRSEIQGVAEGST
jgi:hypothetical protein